MLLGPIDEMLDLAALLGERMPRWGRMASGQWWASCGRAHGQSSTLEGAAKIVAKQLRRRVVEDIARAA